VERPGHDPGSDLGPFGPPSYDPPTLVSEQESSPSALPPVPPGHPLHISSFRAQETPKDPFAIALHSKASPSEMHEKWEIWADLLAEYPDRALVEWFIHSLRFGFMLGSSLACDPTKKTRRNNNSALEHQSIVEEAIKKEIDLGRIIGPLDSIDFHDPVFINPLGIASKRASVYGQPPKLRLTTDMTQSGFNDSIHEETSRMRYISFEHICKTFDELPPTASCYLIDIKSAFRHLALAPEEYRKCVFVWKDKYYVDTRLCFGCATGPVLWDQVGLLLQWIVQRRSRVPILRLLDDNLGYAHSSSTASSAFLSFQEVAASVGVPLAEDKKVAPCRRFQFLGVLWDLDLATAFVPEAKWRRLQDELSDIANRQNFAISFQQLESIVGFLSWCSMLAPLGRCYLRSSYNFIQGLLSKTHGRRSPRMGVSVPAPVRDDWSWWSNLTRTAPTASLRFNYFSYKPGMADLVITTDASPSGFGAHWLHFYLAGEWPPSLLLGSEGSSTTLLEIATIYIALSVWGEHCRHKHVIVRCDNEAVHKAWKKRSSPSSRINNVIRLITSLSLFYSVANVNIIWIHSKHNAFADLLSRLQGSELFSHPEFSSKTHLVRSCPSDALMANVGQL
jgi:hypothetical protein